MQYLVKLWDSFPEMLRHIIIAVIVFIIFWLLARLIASIVCRFINTKHQSVLHLMKNTLRRTILVIGVIAALGAAGVNLGALIASAGLMGFAIGYVLRDLLSNIIAGILLIFNKTIKKGDRVIISGFEGTVEKIELRYTTLKANEKIYLVPNNKLFTSILTILQP